MKVAAFLPAKGSSSRIESKNTKLLDGKPLFVHTLEKLKRCELIDEIYLDSESENIFALASEYDHIPLARDPDLANNATDGHTLFANSARQVEADIYVQILCTSPFIKPETIDKAITVLKDNDEYDSVVLVKNEKQYTWTDGKPDYNFEKIPNSNTLPDTVIETMGLYVTRREVAIEMKKRIGTRPFLLEADVIEAVDVNYPEEFELANYIMAGMRESNNVKYRNLSRLLSSAMLSDIMDDFGIDSFIRGLKPNLSDKKVLGKAKTLKLRALEEGESYRGIYDALESYDTIVPGDIILVENEVSEFAYFGNLNANLAIRQGSVGAIIGGHTRDFTEVAKLDFPVFAQGYSARDVRKRATLESINKTIHIEGVKIRPGDLVFADNDGVIVIPAEMENKVLLAAMETINKENKIIVDIVQSMNGAEIIKINGEF